MNTAMFDLDENIAEWQRQLVLGGLKTPEILDELECHLREDVKQQTRTGFIDGLEATASSRVSASDSSAAQA